MKQLEVLAIVAIIVLLGGYVIYGLFRANQVLRRDKRAGHHGYHKQRKSSKRQDAYQNNQNNQE